VIAELAAFNAAFGVVKEFVANGKDLSDCFGFIGQMTTGLWDDFVKFQAEARKARLLERNERIKTINQRWQYASLIVAGCLGLIGVYAIFMVASAVLGG
jgi:hypothetical protein